jgi:5-methyltetrahydrofolate--homocysteine methyltransferase
MMHKVVHRLSMAVDAPLVFDSTEPDVLQAALEISPGRAMINSIHLEGGREKADKVLPLAKAHGAAVIALTIDEQGMAKTVERKVEVAKKIYDIAVNEYGLRPDDLIFDALTFTLATGDPEFADSAVQTIDAIKQIKDELPGVLTSLGVSNVSFGLSKQARPVLNSVMLYHCVQAGLDMAIVNPAHIKPYAEISDEQRQLVEDLIFNRHKDALAKLIEYFEAVEADPQEASADPTEGMTPEQRLQWRVLHRHKEGVEADIDEILDRYPEQERDEGAVTILNEVLLPAMKEVGDRFGAGELILPFVLQSAEVMKKAVSHVERYLDRVDGVSKGRVVLATVYGDVHDIGKNLVKTILANNGYEVHDLGKQVPANTIIDTAIELEADAIGLSALLVSTSKQMPLIVNELQRRKAQIPVLIGGAAINRRFGRRITMTEDGDLYPAGVFYCKDAFDGLSVMDSLKDPQRRADLLADRAAEARRELGLEASSQRGESLGRSSVEVGDVPAAPDYGPRVVESMPLELVFEHLFIKELYRLSWGAKNAHGEEWERLEAEFAARLATMKKEALQSGWLQPQGVYGYWPVQSDGEELVVYDPNTVEDDQVVELTRFSFPRQPSGDQLCLSDYFAPTSSDRMDVVALQIVTVGQGATQRVAQLEAEGDYSESYFAHGLAVQTAEAAAEYLHRHIRRELGLKEDQGKRYSWGYPAIPELADHEKVFQLLPAGEALGMTLSPAYQLIPEQSTAAIVVHHPEAKYFSVGTSRIEQLMSNPPAKSE